MATSRFVQAIASQVLAWPAMIYRQALFAPRLAKTQRPFAECTRRLERRPGGPSFWILLLICVVFQRLGVLGELSF